MSAPSIKFNVFTVAAGTPSGSRHLESAGNWSQKADATSNGFISLGDINNTSAKASTSTIAVVPYIDALNGSTTIDNMKFWMPVQTAVTTGTYTFNQSIATAWISGIALTDASGSFSSSTLPTSQNVNRTTGETTITAAAADAQVMQYCYLSVTADTDVPNGTYGGADGSIKHRLTFDFS
jgi:hypothetical protein